MLSQLYPEDRLQQILISRSLWRPFPTASERAPWEALPAPVRRAHLERGEAALGREWPSLPAVRFLDFVRNGDRSGYQALHFGNRHALADLVLAECMEGQGRFLDDITNGIWALCEESFWGVPAHIGMQKAGPGLPDVTEPIVDLFAAETSALLAWTVYLLGPQLDTISPLIVRRVEHEIQRRMLIPLRRRDDFGWMGSGGQRVNNWNPWICSNWLASALLIEREEARRLRSVAKAIRTLDRFLDPYPRDGGCDEGPSYWGRAGASLYDCLELLHSATGGEVDVYREPLVQEIGRFIYRVQIADRYFVNFADAPARLVPAPALVYGYGRRIGDPDMMALGAWSARELDLVSRGVGESLGRALPALFSLEELAQAGSTLPLPRDVWLEEIQVMVARDREGSVEGLFVAAKGGHNAESHNHNDIGSFIIFRDGRPILIDAGVEEYTARTFGPHRYEIWTMQSAYHNLPTIRGVQQAPGAQYAARSVGYRADTESAELTLDIASAYPEEAQVKCWMRTVMLKRGEAVTVTDVCELATATGDLTLNLLTPCRVAIREGGVIELGEAALAEGYVSGSARLHYQADRLQASAEEILIEDRRLQEIWGRRLARILLTARQAASRHAFELRLTT